MGDSVDEEYYNNALNWSEWSNYALLEALKNRWIELNIENLKALWASSWEFLLWMKDWALQLWEDSITELIETPETIWNIIEATAMSFAKWFELTWKWMAVWVALANKSFRNDYVWDKVLENALADIEVEWIEVNRQIDEFISSAEELLELAKYAYANLDKIENSEYYGWYITWYIDAIIAEWIALTIATRNWKVAWQTIQNGKSFIKISQLLYKFRVAWEIFKITFNKVNFDLLSKLDKIEVENLKLLWVVIKDWPIEKQARFYERMNIMDEYTYKQYILNREIFTNKFEVDWYYNMVLKKSFSWKKWTLLDSTDWIMRNGSWKEIAKIHKKIDYIIQNWEIKIWDWHSYVSGWDNITYGWEIEFYGVWEFDKNWNLMPNYSIKSINNQTWHYKPWVFWRQETIRLFKEKIWVDLTDVFEVSVSL